LFISNLVSRVPIERVLFPPRDNTKALEEFAATITAPQVTNKAPPEQKATPIITQEPEAAPKQETVATACIPCCLGHFSVSAGLLNEAVRCKKEGITSNEVLDRIAKTLQELNALERVDLTPEKIRSAPDWERDIAEEALQQSRSLRHRLETIKGIEELDQAAADTEGYYRSLHREWWKRRLAKTGETKPEMSLKDKERVLKRAEELIEEV